MLRSPNSLSRKGERLKIPKLPVSRASHVVVNQDDATIYRRSLSDWPWRLPCLTGYTDRLAGE
jgi:hypothetical protein